MSNEIERRVSSQGSLARNPQVQQPSLFSAASRDLRRQDELAVVRERGIILDGANEDTANEVDHIVQMKEAERRGERVQDSMARARVLRRQAQLLAEGEGEAAYLENMDFYRVWKANEIYRHSTDFGRF
ncbi:Uncharacterised protein [Mycobacteroides abscessus subsp. abscessus]|uniref:hypothetical protein n=1 Tax=Mycobacteroides abscessus TaxID=36809 RepID=UPI00092C3952|nr:hypothetical protein [Mycobacteroides abscessus]SHV14834.1 Uncharacterised protein [Mycobacteroides abscessus subsp. abscessus]SKD11167.1 Uncharacterised protein [Mycobacteroides abscessus subsp. abscessus]SKL37674.1 Uncharacterised protein [Mycobacteroides abscessus subsp. abscessus]SKM28164.1 Uncharacterised protein [Mycobacteroides abscessus subsp. abscessus]